MQELINHDAKQVKFLVIRKIENLPTKSGDGNKIDTGWYTAVYHVVDEKSITASVSTFAREPSPSGGSWHEVTINLPTPSASSSLFLS